MTGQRVPVQFLQAGDVIRLRHHHNRQGGECLSRWRIDAVVPAAIFKHSSLGRVRHPA